MKSLPLNSNWSFYKVGDNNKRTVDIPHDAMFLEERKEDNPSSIGGAYFGGNDYVYEKILDIKSDGSSTYILECEGVYNHAEVYVDEQLIFTNYYGFSNFYVDITRYITKGNTLKIVAKNSLQPNCRWYSGAGIYRPVYLHVLPQKHIYLNGIKVRSLSAQNGEVEVCVNTNSCGIMSLQLYFEGRLVTQAKLKTTGEVRHQFKIKEPKLWGVVNPNLYTIRANFEGDVAQTTFGLRDITITPTEGFLLNGERVILRGACIHSDNGLLGAITHPYCEERKVRLLKNAGYNAVRCAHNPASKYFLEACDRLGMLVIDELYDGWYVHKTRYDNADYVEKGWQTDLKNFIEKDYNHPSVVVYSLGNEVAETSKRQGVDFYKCMQDYAHSMDDTRLVTCGVNIFFNLLYSLGLGVYSNKKAQKKPKKEVGSAFFNKLAGIFGANFMKCGAMLKGSDIKTRKIFAVADIAGYNYGIYRYQRDVKRYPNRIILGSETFCSDAFTFFELAKKYPQIIGDFVWAGMDYLGEVGIGSWEYKQYAPTFKPSVGWISAGSGRIDLCGNELGEALYTKVAFDKLPIAMAVRPVCFSGQEHSPSSWKYTNAIPSWSWKGFEGKKAVVEVYARGNFVKLYINNKQIASKKIKKGCRAIFKTKYRAGTLKAVSYNEKGKKIAQTTLVTAGVKTALELTVESERIRQSELAYVHIEITDGHGNVKPYVKDDISVEVIGGKLLALGNACPYNSIGYHGNNTNTYYGRALDIIEPTSGRIVVKAKGEVGCAKCKIKVL